MNNEDLNLIVAGLRSKVEKLIHLHKKSEEDKKNNFDKSLRLEKIIELKDEQIKELENKNRILRLVKSVSGTDETKTEVKQKINELVREIDKCISFLNR